MKPTLAFRPAPPSAGVLNRYGSVKVTALCARRRESVGGPGLRRTVWDGAYQAMTQNDAVAMDMMRDREAPVASSDAETHARGPPASDL